MIELAISERGAVDYYIAVYLVFTPRRKKDRDSCENSRKVLLFLRKLKQIKPHWRQPK